MRTEQKKSQEAASLLISSAREWQAGSEEARTEVSWAASEYSSILRRHLDRLKNLIFPLLEQNVTSEDEQRIAQGLNTIVFENTLKDSPDKYLKLIESLEDELSDWK
jgi:hemerythrin-like domain-containing protein